MTNFDYIPVDIASRAFEMAGLTHSKIAQACMGVSFSKILEAENEIARMANSQPSISVALGSFDRSINGERRADRVYRTVLLPTVLELITPDFIKFDDAINQPADYAELAHLQVDERSISVIRFKVDAHTPESVEGLDTTKLDSNGTLPGIVQYNLIVARDATTATAQA